MAAKSCSGQTAANLGDTYFRFGRQVAGDPGKPGEPGERDEPGEPGEPDKLGEPGEHSNMAADDGHASSQDVAAPPPSPAQHAAKDEADFLSEMLWVFGRHWYRKELDKGAWADDHYLLLEAELYEQLRCIMRD